MELTLLRKINMERRNLLQDALIQITTTQTVANEKEPETIELTTEGCFYMEDGKIRLVYEETEISGMEGTTTTLNIVPDKITLNRFGTQIIDMEFSSGQRYKTIYRTPFGDMPMEILTKNIEVNFQKRPLDLKATIDYEVSVKNFFSGRNKMTIQARKKQ